MFFTALTIYALSATTPAWTLADCLALAEKNQPELAAAAAGVRASAAAAGGSLGALGPQFNATGAAVRSTAPLSTSSPQTILPAYDVFSAGLQGTWSLWDGNRFYAWRAAEAGADAATLGAELAKNETANNVASAFYGVEYAARVLAVRREIAAAAEELATQARILVAAGRQAPIDAVRAEAALATAQADVVQAENAALDATNALLTAMGLPLETPHGVTGPATVAPFFPYDLTAYTNLLREREPGLAAVRRQTDAARATVRGAQWTHLPTLTAGAGYGWRSPDTESWRTNWNLGLTLNVPLFASGQTANRVAEQRALADRAAARLRSLEQRTAQAGAGYYNAFHSATRRYAALEAARRAADANLALALGRYRAGAGSIIEVVDAELLLATTAIGQAAGLRDLQTARARALTAAGLPLPTEPP